MKIYIYKGLGRDEQYVCTYHGNLVGLVEHLKESFVGVSWKLKGTWAVVRVLGMKRGT
jgi:hypothetical protein